MLAAAGVDVKMVGFHRSWGKIPSDVPVIDLGLTRNGAMVERAIMIARTLLGVRRYRDEFVQSQAAIARTLEMLVIAVISSIMLGKRRHVVYECLDIHRSLSGNGIASRMMRLLERRLMAQCALLVTSSPRFIAEHFEREGPLQIPCLVLENKVLALGALPAERRVTVAAQPWIIGWFGILRCAKSLAMLVDIVARSNGSAEVLLAGRPSYNEIPDFDEVVNGTPGLRFLGAYAAKDLPDIYGMVHFAWCVDYMEDGQNSAWLLPNRIYESVAYGAVPIALRHVETGAWLMRHEIGVVLDDPNDDLPGLLDCMEGEEFERLQGKVRSSDRSRFVATREDCFDYVHAIERATVRG